MRLIAHRGLFNGPDKTSENTLDQIQLALSTGFDVEIDVWFIAGKYYLGHDYAVTEVTREWLEDDRFWIHAKNDDALVALRDLNVFWHQSDDYVLTSKGYIWCYPGKPVPNDGVMVMPEHANVDLLQIPDNVYAVCSDYVQTIKDSL